MKITYSSNNSGGGWWLSDNDWKNLEKAGWDVAWIKDSPYHNGEERWLGCLAKEATKEFPASTEYIAINMAISEWEDITGQFASEIGCTCCGQPHYFHEAYD